MTTWNTRVGQHPAEVRGVHARPPAGTPVHDETVQDGVRGRWVRVPETGTGSPVVLGHGTNGSPPRADGEPA